MSPAVLYGSLLWGASIVESVGNTSFIDFIIDHRITQMRGHGVPTPIIPSAGDALLPGHLPAGSWMFHSFEYPIRGTYLQTYRLVNRQITISKQSVLEPATLALMGLGLAGIGYRRHRSKKAA
jgi:hypothetical protein